MVVTFDDWFVVGLIVVVLIKVDVNGFLDVNFCIVVLLGVVEIAEDFEEVIVVFGDAVDALILLKILLVLLLNFTLLVVLLVLLLSVLSIILFLSVLLVAPAVEYRCGGCLSGSNAESLMTFSLMSLGSM